MLEWFLLARHLRRRGLQNWITIGGVAIGVMVLLVALSLYNGFSGALVSASLAIQPHLTLLAAGGLGDYGRALELVRADPEVVAAMPYVEGQAVVGHLSPQGRLERGSGALLWGMVPELAAGMFPAGQLEISGLDRLKGEAIILGKGLARMLVALPGDQVRVGNIAQASRDLEVVGTFESGFGVFDDSLALLPLDTMLALYQGLGPGITGIQVRLKDPERAPEVARRLWPLVGLYPQTWQSRNQNLLAALELQKRVSFVVVFLIVLVAAFGIANVMILTVLERTREIGMLRAMGASQSRVLRVFLLEGLSLGLLGTSLGVGLAVLVCLYFRWRPFPVPGRIYFISGVPAEMQAGDFLWVCALSVVTILLASLLPARRAARLNPAEVLR
ncbi:MAG: ABC transporter permease [Deinococcus sp.]|nr:ABC transporter permease [Deinococcus sp.]